MEKLENIVFDKSEVVSQFQGELLQNIIQDDPEIREFIDDIYLNRITPSMVAFFKEGIQQGYIDPRFSPDTIICFFEIFRRGFFASSLCC